MKKSFTGFSKRLDTAQERIHDMPIEIILTETQKE